MAVARVASTFKTQQFVLQDQHELEEQLELQAGVLGRISDIVHHLFVSLQEQFLPYYSHMNEKFAALIAPGRAWRDRQWGTCIFDDVIEYSGYEGRRLYKDCYIEPLLRHIGDEYPEVRQAAAYGMGVLAMKGGDEYAQTCARALPLLANSINMPNAREVSRSRPKSGRCSQSSGVLSSRY